jgi:hypothetical protein
MRKSQIAVLSVLGALALLIVAAIIAARLIAARLESGAYADEPRRPADSTGPVTSDTHDLSGFDRVDARGMWEIEIKQGTAWDVALAYPDNTEDRPDVRVEDGRLILESERRRWSWFGGGDDATLEATITMPALEGIDLSGASELTLSGFSGETLEITASGATEIDGSNGSYRELQLVVSGAGDVNLGELVVVDARVVLSGAGDIVLNMNGGVLSGTVSGAGQIRYRGTVSEENVVTSGFSSVDAED